MINRVYKDNIKSLLGSNKAIIIFGARQVGKSTLLQQILGDTESVLWLNGDDSDIRLLFEDVSSSRLKAVIGTNKFVVIDEAQRIKNIGLKIKMITDQIPGVQVLATGSSALQLSNEINEPLTGRKREFKMFPISFREMCNHTSLLEELRMIPHRLIYGYYPEVVTSVGEEKIVLRELANSYLYKDILSFDKVKHASKLESLLQAIAFQIGSQVSSNEIGRLVGLDSKTVERYIDLLEQSFVIFRLCSFARNQRNELKNSRKIFFWDTGIRNAVIGNFSPIENRNDAGALWENYVIAERLKANIMSQSFARSWFWRTQQQQEVDYIEDENGFINAYEIKWNTKKANTRCPVTFSKAYPEANYNVITPDNIEKFL